MLRFFTIMLIILFGVQHLVAQEIVQWRGPYRSGYFPETGLKKSWPENGPELILEIEGFGGGYSSPVIYNDIIYVTGMKDSVDVVSAYDLRGNKKWETEYAKSWYRTYPETRCTPTIENGYLYLAGGEGEVCCIDAKTGDIKWTVSALKKYNGEVGKYGVAESLLLTDQAVIYCTGGNETTIIALNKDDGRLVWKSGSIGGLKVYVSPALVSHNGKQMIIAQTSNDLFGVDATNGEILWTYDIIHYHTGRQGKTNVTNTPLYLNGEIFTTSGYNHPGLMLKLSDDGRSVSLKWRNDSLDCHIGGVVLVDGYIYGSSWEHNGYGKWTCVNWNTGELMYHYDWINKGSVIYADGHLYCYEEKSGTIALVKPDPVGFNIISAFRVEKGNGPYWSHPAIFDGILVLRHGDVLFLYDIKQ